MSLKVRVNGRDVDEVALGSTILAIPFLFIGPGTAIIAWLMFATIGAQMKRSKVKQLPAKPQKKLAEKKHPIFTSRPASTRRAARKIWDALEAKGFKGIKLWYDVAGPNLEMCGPSGGWFCEVQTGSVDHTLGYSVAEALATIAELQPVLKE